MREYTYYFFDLFHTLVKIEPYYDIKRREHNILGISLKEWSKFAEYDYTNRALGFINDPEKIVRNIVSQINNDFTEEEILLVYEIRKQRFRKALVEINEVILNTIITLREKNKVLVLISNADAFDKMFWNESPLSSYFNEAVFSCDVKLMKPDIEIYLLAKDKVKADINRSVFIGDGGHNELEGAKKAGFNTILTTEIIKDYWPEKINELSRDVDHVINDLSELLNY